MKRVLITGAGGGLGAAIARRFAEEGYAVIAADRDLATAEATARSLPGASAYRLDVTDEAACEALLDALGEVPDVLVNNAGIVRFSNILEHSVEDFRRVLDVNLTGTFVMCKLVGRRMAARGAGSIVNIASLNGVMASPDTGSYPASKAGVAKLTEQFALVLGKDGVRVNAVSPGFINAGMSAPIYADAEAARVRGGAVPLGRLGEAQDVADAVFYLASDRAAYITGANLLVDGGVSFSLKNQLPRKAPVQPA